MRFVPKCNWKSAGSNMDEHDNRTFKQYGKWLVVASIVGGLAGWIVQGVIQDYRFWSLPLFCLLAFVFTLNGDNIGESLVVLLILGILVLLTPWSNKDLAQVIGRGTLWGCYVALCVSKIGFACAKEGVFGNDPFS